MHTDLLRVDVRALVIAVSILSGAASSSAWNLVPCSPSETASREAFGRELRAAKPDSRLYLPHPFPRNEPEVLADFQRQIAHWHALPEGSRPQQAALLEALTRGEVDTEVVRVTNWGPQRCSNARSGDQYLLISFRGADGAEIARAAMDESGLLQQTGFPEGNEPAILNREGVVEQLAVKLRIREALSPIHVTSTGTLRCDVLMPCVAVRAQGSMFIVGADFDVFEILPGRRSLSLKNDLALPDKRAAKLNEMSKKGEFVTSTGGDEFVVLRRVGRLRD